MENLTAYFSLYNTVSGKRCAADRIDIKSPLQPHLCLSYYVNTIFRPSHSIKSNGVDRSKCRKDFLQYFFSHQVLFITSLAYRTEPIASLE